MSEYQVLYKQSLVQIQKQKQQIRKLQEQIRERCQSYLIHSSRYRSRKSDENSQPNSVQKSQLMQSKSSVGAAQPEQNVTELQFTSNTINIVIENSPIKKQDVDEYTQTIQQSTKVNKNGLHHSSSLQNQINTSEKPEQKQLFGKKSLQDLSSIRSKQSQPSNHSFIVNSQPKQNGQSNMNWPQIVEGLKQRLYSVQKLKSQQAQKINDLQQQLRIIKKQRRSKVDVNESVQRKTSSRIEDNNNVKEQSNIDRVVKQQITTLWKNLSNKINFNNNLNMEENFNNLTTYMNELQAKIKCYEQKQEKRILDQSKVSSYNFNTPYRKLKDQSNYSQDKDIYEQDQLELLRRKCKQLQAQLSQSRIQKDLSPLKVKAINNQQIQQNKVQNEQQIVHQPAYLIEQQLQKPIDPYVKRNFVRKKVVKRNLSAMILRSPSKSKEESKAAMTAQLQKLKKRIESSNNGSNDRQVLSLSRRVQRLQKNLQINQKKIDEISDEQSSIARTSGVSQGYFTQIIQVQTEGPGFKNYTAHILGLSRKDKNNNDSKIKQNPYI